MRATTIGCVGVCATWSVCGARVRSGQALRNNVAGFARHGPDLQYASLTYSCSFLDAGDGDGVNDDGVEKERNGAERVRCLAWICSVPPAAQAERMASTSRALDRDSDSDPDAASCLHLNSSDDAQGGVVVYRPCGTVK